MSCIYRYKGKDYTKDEFYSLVRNTMVQPRTVQKYNKILFPTGNTASKIEGHTTLEEFKKQKEDRIKEIEKSIEDFNNKNYKEVYKEGKPKPGSINGETYSKLEAETFYQKVYENSEINKKLNEINQLKQELETVETEGFGALKPIYNFYENTVANILKKQGYNPKLITDEYGNTWNEVVIPEDEKNKVCVF